LPFTENAAEAHRERIKMQTEQNVPTSALIIAAYLTSDLNLAAYLLALDYPLRGLNGPPGQRAFTFANVAEKDVEAFYAGAKVDARKLLGALRDLKGLLAQRGRP